MSGHTFTSRNVTASRTTTGRDFVPSRKRSQAHFSTRSGARKRNGYRTTVLTLGGSPQDIQDVATREKGSVGQDNERWSHVLPGTWT